MILIDSVVIIFVIMTTIIVVIIVVVLISQTSIIPILQINCAILKYTLMLPLGKNILKNRPAASPLRSIYLLPSPFFPLPSLPLLLFISIPLLPLTLNLLLLSLPPPPTLLPNTLLLPTPPLSPLILVVVARRSAPHDIIIVVNLFPVATKVQCANART